MRKELANGIYRQFNETFREPSDEEVQGDKFHKSKRGNFEKVRREHGIGGEAEKKPATMQSTPANLKQLNKMAKQMMKGNREEMQRMRKMAEEIQQDNQSHTISDESLSRHI